MFVCQLWLLEPTGRPAETLFSRLTGTAPARTCAPCEMRLRRNWRSHARQLCRRIADAADTEGGGLSGPAALSAGARSTDRHDSPGRYANLLWPISDTHIYRFDLFICVAHVGFLSYLARVEPPAISATSPISNEALGACTHAHTHIHRQTTWNVSTAGHNIFPLIRHRRMTTTIHHRTSPSPSLAATGQHFGASSEFW